MFTELLGAARFAFSMVVAMISQVILGHTLGCGPVKAELLTNLLISPVELVKLNNSSFVCWGGYNHSGNAK